MMQSNAILIALVGFLSALVGGAIQAWTARTFEREKFGRQARYDAYGAYFRAVGELSFAASQSEEDAAHAKIAEARGRIALYGSPAVIGAMAQAFRHGSDLHSSEARPDHARMIAAMRADVDPRAHPANDEDLFELLYGRERRSSEK